MTVDNLLETWTHLGERERKVLLTVGMRLLAGQRIHGKLSVDKKDWTYEALEEHLDATVYLAAALSDKADKAFRRMVSDAEAEVKRPTNWTDGL